MLIALCDDVNAQLSVLEDAVRNCKIWRGLTLDVERFNSGEKLVESICSGSVYDFIFLDIKMPGLSGFDVYVKLDGLCDRSIVFVSSYTDLLPEVFSLRPHGFLVKGFNQDTFDRTVVSVNDQRADNDFFKYNSKGVDEIISCAKIVFFITRNHEVYMHRVQGDPLLLTNTNLDAVERQLFGHGFFRCNRSTLINLRYCSAREGEYITMRLSDVKINISRRKLKEFDQWLMRFRMGDKNEF